MTIRGAQTTATDSTIELVTKYSEESFAEVTTEVERLFQLHHLDKLIRRETGFECSFSCNRRTEVGGGIPIESKL